MRFSIQVQDEPKMFFHFIPAAEKATGLSRQTIRDVLERGNKVYYRQSDHKLFSFSKEDPILIAKIEGEDFFSLEEIHEKLGISPTKFLNQINKNKFAKKIDWISDELFPEKLKQEKEPDQLEEMKSQLEEMRCQLEEMKSQFQKQQEEMKSQFQKQQEEIDRLSSREEKEKASPPEKVSPPVSQEVFKPPHVFVRHSFTIKSVAKFIRDGLVCDIRSAGPKTHRYVLVNNQREYLPDLVKQIIQDHILPVLQSETQEEREQRLESYLEIKTNNINGLTLGELAALRRGINTLAPSVITDLSKEIMKMI